MSALRDRDVRTGVRRAAGAARATSSGEARASLSDFGPLENPVFPLWWDMLVVAAFSLVVYGWAMRVALTAERIDRMIGEVVLPEEVGAADQALTRER